LRGKKGLKLPYWLLKFGSSLADDQESTYFTKLKRKKKKEKPFF
jgi:hypothetical protein